MRRLGPMATAARGAAPVRWMTATCQTQTRAVTWTEHHGSFPGLVGARGQSCVTSSSSGAPWYGCGAVVEAGEFCITEPAVGKHGASVEGCLDLEEAPAQVPWHRQAVQHWETMHQVSIQCALLHADFCWVKGSRFAPCILSHLHPRSVYAQPSCSHHDCLTAICLVLLTPLTPAHLAVL